MPAPEAILTLSNVVSGYGKMTILSGISASIRRGAITTVIGPNGALQISNYGLVLEQGQARIEGRAASILADRRIAQLFLGGGLQETEKAG